MGHYTYDRRASLFSPSYDKELDHILDGLLITDKAIEKAHGSAPEGTARAILTGLHQDLFETMAEFRKYIRQLKSLA